MNLKEKTAKSYRKIVFRSIWNRKYFEVQFEDTQSAVCTYKIGTDPNFSGLTYLYLAVVHVKDASAGGGGVPVIYGCH